MRILVVGDVHEPVAHPKYLKFCQDLRDEWETEKVVFIGDLVDLHAVTFHARHPEAPGPSDETELTKQRLRPWYEAFPEAVVTTGNHDARVIRKAEDADIPSQFLRNHEEVWETPGWKWVDDTVLDGIYFFHGTGRSGEHPSFNAMKTMAMSCVMGHVHHAAGVKWLANPKARFFGMDTGCGIDDKQAAFAYGRANKRRSMLGAGVILDGVPYHEIMPCGPGEKYHRRSKARWVIRAR